MTSTAVGIRVSPSRLGTYADCGEKYRFKYVEQAAVERSSSSRLFGLVVHKAREQWVTDRQQDMVSLMRQAWRDVTKGDPILSEFIQWYSLMSEEAIEYLAQIQRDRPEIKMPRRTKDWTESDLAFRIQKLIADWLPRLEATKYDFAVNDPLPALYDESITLAGKYSLRWRHLPNALYTEFAFNVSYHGFVLNGYIDDISPLLIPGTGEMIGYGVVDAKTYRDQPLHTGKDSRQLTMYDIAVRDLWEQGVFPDIHLDQFPLYVGVDQMRLLEMKFFQIGADAGDILLRDLHTYQRAIENQVFIPAAKTCSAQMCDFRNQCIHNQGSGAREIDLVI